ncbi:UDP-N-acetylmuramate--L-alanine ligase [Streptomyces sp. NRRL B-3648]|uniref:UDP-N-acetylmuramate--L-alanine ligase n=1 Tax=Streptomyces sp. NRRL B-3648 TaxID=1519493 RepID=UPI0006AEA727|nr:Mur ligase domain-containing protein [Streptomyces sp. NRRL B-3648]
MAETAVPTITPDLSAGGPIDLSRVHFVGVGGTGMLPVARVCAERGFTVSGSDVRVTEALKALARLNVRVHTGHAAEHVPADATAVVFTHVIGPDNPEIRAARALGVPVVHRSTVLNVLMAAQPKKVAVMGTHGKSSTAGMLAFALARLGQEPSYVVGADLDVPGSGGHAGQGSVFVAEIDESDRSHVGMNMDVAVITNVGYDHPEVYDDEDQVVDTYESGLALGLREGGTVVIGIDSSGGLELASRLVAAENGTGVVTFGFSTSADWRLTEVSTKGRGSSAVLVGPGEVGYALDLRTVGGHQLLNAAAAVITLHVLGQDCGQAVEQLRYFDGVVRRMTPAFEAGGVRVYDSYAHHPDEVRADLAAARSVAREQGRVITVFQPSGPTRLTVFGRRFGEALAGSDEVVVTGSAQRFAVAGLETLSACIDAAGGTCRHVEPDRAEAAVLAASLARPGDVVVLMGPGDIAEAGQVLRTALGDTVGTAV